MGSESEVPSRAPRGPCDSVTMSCWAGPGLGTLGRGRSGGSAFQWAPQGRARLPLAWWLLRTLLLNARRGDRRASLTSLVWVWLCVLSTGVQSRACGLGQGCAAPLGFPSSSSRLENGFLEAFSCRHDGWGGKAGAPRRRLAQPPSLIQPHCNPATGTAPPQGGEKDGSGPLEVGECVSFQRATPESLLGSHHQRYFFIGCAGSSLSEGFL